MVVVAWALVMGGLAVVFNHLLENQAALMSDQTLAIKRSRDGHFRLEGRINGQIVRMIVDTGASGVSLDASLARRLSLPSSGPRVELSTANGVTEGYRIKLQELRLGDIVLHDVTANVSPNFGDPDEVLLGMTALKHLSLTMQGDTLQLAVPAQ
jgi:aspartyl protease family protein